MTRPGCTSLGGTALAALACGGGPEQVAPAALPGPAPTPAAPEPFRFRGAADEREGPYVDLDTARGTCVWRESGDDDARRLAHPCRVEDRDGKSVWVHLDAIAGAPESTIRFTWFRDLPDAEQRAQLERHTRVDLEGRAIEEGLAELRGCVLADSWGLFCPGNFPDP